MTKEYGFTFIELIIVALIISTLTAIALPAYQNYTVRAKTLDAISITSLAKRKVNNYYQYTGYFPQDNRIAGLKSPEQINSLLINKVTIEGGAIHVLFSNKEPILAGQILSFRPVVTKDSPSSPIHFKCGYDDETYPKNLIVIGEDKTTVAKKYLPGACR